MKKEEIAKQNESLKGASRLLFGEAAELRVVDPRSLRLLKQNARYFKRNTFKQLVDNIKADNRLSSVPLCHLEDGELEVLSGNHRVKASVEAAIPWVLVIVILEDIATSRKIAIQLSHNALVGEDDQQILSDLWARIDDIKARCYAGLSSEQLGELKEVKLVNFTPSAIATKQVVFAFTDPEAAGLDQVLEELSRHPADIVHLAHLGDFQRFFELLQRTKKKKNVRNSALALRLLVEIAAEALAREEAPEGGGEACHS